MPVSIRPYQPADIPALRKLFLQVRSEAFPWSAADSLRLEDFDAATLDEPILVATIDERIVGFVSWWPPANFVHNLFVDSAHQRQGIGQQLLSPCLAQIGRPATLKCVQRNEQALAFYQRQGWQIASEGMGVDGPYYLLELQ